MTNAADWLQEAVKEARMRLETLPKWYQELLRHEVEKSQ